MEEMIMNEVEIAVSKAELFYRLGSWNQCSVNFGGSKSYVPIPEQLEFERLETMTTKLAMSRAMASDKDYKTVLMEVELQVSIYLVKFLEPTIDPALAGTRSLKVEGEGVACGICQEEMGKGEEGRVVEDCMHMFHDSCVLKWLKIKKTCPLCRTICKPKKLLFQDMILLLSNGLINN